MNGCLRSHSNQYESSERKQETHPKQVEKVGEGSVTPSSVPGVFEVYPDKNQLFVEYLVSFTACRHAGWVLTIVLVRE